MFIYPKKYVLSFRDVLAVQKVFFKNLLIVGGRDQENHSNNQYDSKICLFGSSLLVPAVKAVDNL